jgi:hypothetical protein
MRIMPVFWLPNYVHLTHPVDILSSNGVSFQLMHLLLRIINALCQIDIIFNRGIASHFVLTRQLEGVYVRKKTAIATLPYSQGVK